MLPDSAEFAWWCRKHLQLVSAGSFTKAALWGLPWWRSG